MKLLGLDIKKITKPEPKVVTVQCYGCARYFSIATKEQRVYNYCSSC